MWTLVGLLAVVSATGLPLPAVELPVQPLTSQALLLEADTPTLQRRMQRVRREPSQRRYWRCVADGADTTARHRLGCPPSPVSASRSLARYLRRFVRPPTA